MSHVMAFSNGRSSPVPIDEKARLAAQTEILVDAIAGGARVDLEGLPTAVIYARLCHQLRTMGLEPAQAKVLRVAAWIHDDAAEDEQFGNHAA